MLPGMTSDRLNILSLSDKRNIWFDTIFEAESQDLKFGILSIVFNFLGKTADTIHSLK
jgi:hypothetical protein